MFVAVVSDTTQVFFNEYLIMLSREMLIFHTFLFLITNFLPLIELCRTEILCN